MATPKLQDFKLLKIIGSGASCVVFAAEHEDKMYAIKAARKEACRKSDFGITEKNILMKISHPFIVKFFGCFSTDTRLCYILEYAPGGDLSIYLRRNNLILPLDIVKFYAAELSLAIGFLHQKGIVHRDIKLRNILIDSEGHAKLADFGGSLEQNLEGRKNSIRGTLRFLAPEVVKNEPYSFEVDWWSFGVCLYVMLYGRYPFEYEPGRQTIRSTKAAMNNRISFPRSIPHYAIVFLKGLLEKKPKRRLGRKGYVEIRSHPFFWSMDWQKIENKQVEPPFKPQLESSTDFRYFHQDKLEDPHSLTKNDESNRFDLIFKDFDYVNPDWKN